MTKYSHEMNTKSPHNPSTFLVAHYVRPSKRNS